MPGSLQANHRLPLTADERAEANKALALTERRHKARAKRFTPFGVLVDTDHVRLTLQRQEPRGAKNFDSHPVARVGNYLQVNFGEDEWLCWYTQGKMKKFAGSVGLQRVVCAVAGLQLDNVEVKPGVLESLEVHHLDINPLNNRIKNLMPLRKILHNEVHREVRRGEFEAYDFPPVAWLVVAYKPYTTGVAGLEATIEDSMLWGARRSATAAKIAAIVGTAGPDGITRAEVIAQAQQQKIGEGTARNALVALVKGGLLAKVGHGRYVLAAEGNAAD